MLQQDVSAQNTLPDRRPNLSLASAVQNNDHLLRPKHVSYTRPVSRIYGGRPRNSWLYEGRVGYGRHPYTPSLSSLVTCHYTECVPEMSWGNLREGLCWYREAPIPRMSPEVHNDTGRFFCITEQTLHCILTLQLLILWSGLWSGWTNRTTEMSCLRVMCWECFCIDVLNFK